MIIMLCCADPIHVQGRGLTSDAGDLTVAAAVLADPGVLKEVDLVAKCCALSF